MSDRKQWNRTQVLQSLATLRMVRIEFGPAYPGVEIPDLYGIRERDVLAERVRELEEAQLCHGCSAGPESGMDFYCNDCANVTYEYSAPTPPLPVCPKCGVVRHSTTDNGKYELFGCDCPGADPYSTLESWQRRCAGNTPCKVCGKLPTYHSAKRSTRHLYRCSETYCSEAIRWLTPAEWLDNNKEMDDERRNDTDGDKGTEGATGKTPSQEQAQATAKEARDKDGQVASPRAEALRRAREALKQAYNPATVTSNTALMAYLVSVSNRAVLANLLDWADDRERDS